MSGGFGLPIVDIAGGLARLGDRFQEGYDRAQAPDILAALLKANGGTGPAAAPGGMPAPTGGGGQLFPAPRPPSFAGGQSAMTLPSSNKEIETSFIDSLRAGGLTNPNGLAAAAAYASHESRYSPKNITGSWSDPSESGQPGTSGGILSWRGPRLDAMRSFTAGAKDPVKAQAQFFLTENPALTMGLQNAKSPEEAHRLMAEAWKFAGFNRAGGENAARLGSTRAYLDRLAGMPGGDQPSTAPMQVAGALPGLPGSRPPLSPLSSGGALGMYPGNVYGVTAPPQQVAEGNPRADMPVRGAREAGFVIPPGSASALPQGLSGAGDGRGGGGMPTSSDPAAPPRAFSAPPAPASAVGLPGVGGAQRSIDPELLSRALQNRVTAPFAQAAIAAQLKTGDDYAFTAVGDQFYRTNRRTGSVELVPGVTKPQTTTVGQGQTLVDQVTGRPIFASPAAPTNVAAGGRLVDPATGREIYAAPDKPVSVAPGGRLVDPNSGAEVYAAPEKSAAPSFVQMNGRLLVTDPDTQTARDVTPKDLPQGYRPATPQERRDFRAKDDTPLFIGPDGKPQTLAGQTINVNNGERAQDQAIGQDYGKRFTEMNRAGAAATGQLSTIATMERAMNSPGFYSGTGGAAHLAFNRGLVSLGVKDSKAAAPNELFDALSNRVILDGLGGSLGAGISNGDRDFIQRTAPDLAKTPQGNAQLLSYARALAQRQQQVAKFAREYYSQNGRRLDPGFDDALAQWAEANPITPGGQQSRPQPQTGPRGAAPAERAGAAGQASRYQQLRASGLSQEQAFDAMAREGH